MVSAMLLCASGLGEVLSGGEVEPVADSLSVDLVIHMTPELANTSLVVHMSLTVGEHLSVSFSWLVSCCTRGSEMLLF